MEEEEREGVIGRILREELVWVNKAYEEDPMDCWINGYRTALNTVLRQANTPDSEEVRE